MTRDHSTGRVFSVIQGGGADLAARPAGSDVSKRFESLAEIKIAGELGLLYFLGLVADCPVSALTDPHTLLRFGRAMPVELNELLCELRNLSWFDSRAFHLPDTHPDAAHRASHWNSAGQLTRNTVFNAGLRPVIGTYRASCLWSSQSGPVMSFRDMAGCLKGVDAGDCMSEAVRLVSAGDTGQRGQGGLTLTRDALLEHLDHAARQAIEETYRQDAHSCKSDRPPVIAAQIAMTMSATAVIGGLPPTSFARRQAIWRKMPRNC